jgi:hypothetical protein
MQGEAITIIETERSLRLATVITEAEMAEAYILDAVRTPRGRGK